MGGNKKPSTDFLVNPQTGMETEIFWLQRYELSILQFRRFYYFTSSKNYSTGGLR